MAVAILLVCTPAPRLGDYVIGRAGLIAMGRGACVEMAQAWCTSDSPMARRINALPKVVFSASLDAVDWPNASVNAGPVEEDIPRHVDGSTLQALQPGA